MGNVTSITAADSDDERPGLSLNSGGMDNIEVTFGTSGSGPDFEVVVMLLLKSEDHAFEILHAMNPQQAKSVANRLKAMALLVEDGATL